MRDGKLEICMRCEKVIPHYNERYLQCCPECFKKLTNKPYAGDCKVIYVSKHKGEGDQFCQWCGAHSSESNLQFQGFDGMECMVLDELGGVEETGTFCKTRQEEIGDQWYHCTSCGCMCCTGHKWNVIFVTLCKECYER